MSNLENTLPGIPRKWNGLDKWQVRPYIRPTCYPAVSGGESVIRLLSLGKLLVNLLQVVKRTNTPLKSLTYYTRKPPRGNETRKLTRGHEKNRRIRREGGGRERGHRVQYIQHTALWRGYTPRGLDVLLETWFPFIFSTYMHTDTSAWLKNVTTSIFFSSLAVSGNAQRLVK